MTVAVSTPGWIAGVVLIALGSTVAAGGLYLLTLAVAALARRPATPRSTSTARLAVLVPAHNEADLIERCMTSLTSQDYPVERFEVIVIADNCTDATPELARAAGARVLIRDAPDARGKGQALRWAMDRILAEPLPPDAFVVVDADSVADRRLLTHLAAHFENGAEAVQAEYLVLDDPRSPRVQLRAVAFLLFHGARFAGRAALRLPCNLVGNGMLFSRPLIERYPWNAFTGAEDLEYSCNLRLAGVGPVFAESARVRGPVPDSGRSAQVQRERWEGGRIHVVRTALPRLLREIVLRRRLSLVDMAVDLVVPPLGLLSVAALTGTMLVLALGGAGLVPIWALIPWLIALVAVVGFVLVGLRAAHAPAWMYRRLISAPVFVLQKILGTAGVLRSRPTDEWIRTERPNEFA